MSPKRLRFVSNLRAICEEQQRMEYKIDFKVKTEPLMQTTLAVTAILALAAIIISTESNDRVTNVAAIAAITVLAFFLRIQ
jgi:hypothetical protein